MVRRHVKNVQKQSYPIQGKRQSSRTQPYWTYFMRQSDTYGWTCKKCPSRGSRDTVGDFVGITYLHTEERPVEGSEGTLVDRLSETRSRFVNIGYPDRCKECNRRYQAHKRAREAGTRLEWVRKSQKGKKWKYLKFVTCTFAGQTWSDAPVPDLKSFKKMWSKTRDEVALRIGALGGTDVIEVVTKEKDGLFKHHIHTHGLWCAPFVKNDEMQTAFKEAGVGRFEFTVLRERSWKDGDEDRSKTALWSAIDYLAKYLTKCQGVKRQVWGALRKWKEHLPQKYCICCIKTTRQIEDYDGCQKKNA